MVKFGTVVSLVSDRHRNISLVRYRLDKNELEVLQKYSEAGAFLTEKRIDNAP